MTLLQRLKCKAGFHGKLIGGVNPFFYIEATGRRNFRIESFLKCKHCGKRVEEKK